MAKFYGKIGFATTKETRPGIWEETIEEKPYYGDIFRRSRSLISSDTINDGINISNNISIVADSFVNSNIFAMRYVEFHGTKWNITNAEVKDKRIELTLGGLWNET